jgi:hypothetical protein
MYIVVLSFQINFNGTLKTGRCFLCGAELQWRSGEISVTPVGYFTGAIENRSCGVNRNDFPKVSFTLDGIWRHMGALFSNWKWIKCLSKQNFYGRDRPFYGRWHDRARFLTFTVVRRLAHRHLEIVFETTTLAKTPYWSPSCKQSLLF